MNYYGRRYKEYVYRRWKRMMIILNMPTCSEMVRKHPLPGKPNGDLRVPASIHLRPSGFTSFLVAASQFHQPVVQQAIRPKHRRIKRDVRYAGVAVSSDVGSLFITYLLTYSA